MKSTYQIKETKNERSFSYTGDLAEAIEKAKKVERIEAFIRIAEKYLKEERENEKATQERKQDT